MSKNIKTRIQNKHDLEVNWLQALNFIPMQGELIIYDSEVDAEGKILNKTVNGEVILQLPEGRTRPYDYVRFKIGDGIHSINELPFADKEFSLHAANMDIHTTAIERIEWDLAKSHADSPHAPQEAEKNQNAFSNIIVGASIITADSTTDTLTLAAGNNVTIIPDIASDTITIAATDTIYTHPTTAGNKHIPTGGAAGQILRWATDGSAVWGDDTAASVASSAINSHSIDTNTHSDIRILIDNLSARLNTLVDSDDTTLDQMSEVVSYLKSNEALIEEITTKKVNISDIIDNLTTNISVKPLSAAQGVALKSLVDTLQAALDSHKHSYAGSSSIGGPAISADKLNSDAGSLTNPVYFVNGIPVKTTYTLSASVPANAVFTDTHYKAVPHAGSSSSTSAVATTNGNTYINIVENGVRSGGINIKGAGATTITSDANGVITVSSTDDNTTYETGTATTSGLTKLYTDIGGNTDGTMTQNAITNAINTLISSGTTDPDTNVTSQFYFKYIP